MIKAEILRKGDIKVKLEIELTVDELKDLGQVCRHTGYADSVMQKISSCCNRISSDVEQIFRGVPDEQ